MDSSPKGQGKENPSCGQTTSPNSSHSSSSSSSNGISPVPLPATPSPRPRSDLPTTPSPNSTNGATTFVQADTSSFKQVVQMLTGSGGGAAHDTGKVSIPPIKTGGPKKPSFKLYERRSSLKNIKLSPLLPGRSIGGVSGFSPRHRHQPEILSPSVLDFPSLVLSPVTPLISEPFNRPGSAPPLAVDMAPTAAEERAIAEKGFYLHPSPRSTRRDVEPRLLPLFPMTSPKVSSGSSS